MFVEALDTNKFEPRRDIAEILDVLSRVKAFGYYILWIGRLTAAGSGLLQFGDFALQDLDVLVQLARYGLAQPWCAAHARALLAASPRPSAGWNNPTTLRASWAKFDRHMQRWSRRSLAEVGFSGFNPLLDKALSSSSRPNAAGRRQL
jgi:hypothetical protein